MRHEEAPVFSVVGDGGGQLVATAIHTGHDVRGDLAPLMVLDEATRLREEDPHTDRIGQRVATRVIVNRSRFEVDLNRERDSCVYREPDDCWGLDVWRDAPLAEELAEESRQLHDAFYEGLGQLLDRVATRGPFVVYDVHSYNHRREGAEAPEEPVEDNPEVNVGTGSLDRERFGTVVDAFMAAMGSCEIEGRPLDVRENVKFKGAHLARWVHERYPGVGCALALEFKKTFMDEWAGEPDEGRLDALARALETTIEPVLAALDNLPTGPSRHGGSAPRRTPRPTTTQPLADPPDAVQGLPDAGGLSTADRVADQALAQLAASTRFLLDLTPVDADEVREAFLAGDVHEPDFTYRELDADPEVMQSMLDAVDLESVEDPTLAHLLRAKARELGLQVDMLRARGSADFLPLSIELYGGVAPSLREQATGILQKMTPRVLTDDVVYAEEFLEMARAEIEHYRSVDQNITMHTEVRDDIVGVLVQGDTLLIGRDAAVARARANALLQHEVGTHLVTQVNGSHQPVKVLGVGLAGYDETQEGLGVLAEIACGGLTPNRLRQLASRVITVHAMVGGASFVQCWTALVDAGVPQASAFTTTMRVFRSGGLTKDAIYLRGVVDLLGHLAADEAEPATSLEVLFTGKLSLADLPLVADLYERGVLHPAVLRPRYLDDPEAPARLRAATQHDLTQLVEGSA